MNTEIIPLEHPITFESLGRPIPENHRFFDTPHTKLLIGPKRCGKTTYILNGLNKKELYNNHFWDIFVFSPNGDQFGKEVISKQQNVYGSFSDEKLQVVKEKAIQNRDDGKIEGDKEPRETLLIIDDAMASKCLRSGLFLQLMSTHRNLNLTIWLSIQDLIALDVRLRNLFDNFVIWRPNYSDLNCMIRLLELPEWTKEDLNNLFKSQNTYNDRKDYLTFNKSRKEIIRNFLDYVIIKQ